MSTVRLLGHFETELDQVHFEVNDSNRCNEAVLNTYCQKMIDQEIDSLTVEFDDNTFVQLLKKSNQISFIEGKIEEMASLQAKLRKELEGEIIKKIPDAPAEVSSFSISTTDQASQTDHARIHSSFLQDLSMFEKGFKKAELYFQPYEAPGGDFYWCRDYQYKSLIVVGDCTGHGIQGAMVSMAVMTLLKQHFRLPPTNIEESIYEFHKKMHDLMEDEDLSVFDVEIGVIYRDKRNQSIDYIGSGINMLHKSGNEIVAHRSKKSQLITHKLTADAILAKPGDQLFVYSDGIVDQFNTADESKLGSAGLKKIVELLPSESSILHFMNHFEKFRGSTRQMDDQTMLILTI